MSEQLHDQDGVTVTSFAGGISRGPCVQISVSGPWGTCGTGDIQLTRDQAGGLVAVLQEFLLTSHPALPPNG